jgi:hypothetical protein
MGRWQCHDREVRRLRAVAATGHCEKNGPIVWPDLLGAALGLSHGIPLNEAIPVEPIDCRDRCHRAVAPSHRRYPDVLRAKDFVDRSAVRVSRYCQTNAQRSADQSCGSGFHCQRRCCHRPRPLSSVGGAPQRITAQDSCISFKFESATPVVGFTEVGVPLISLQQAKVKISRATRTGLSSQASYPWISAEKSDAGS